MANKEEKRAIVYQRDDNGSGLITFETSGWKESRTGENVWFGRELMELLGYKSWQTFKTLIDRAMVSAKVSGVIVDNHFRVHHKMVSIGYGNNRKVEDYTLSKYACFLIAQNGNPAKPQIAQAQAYFAIQTQRQEIRDAEISEIKRIEARKRLSATEKKFSGVLVEHGVTGTGLAEIRSRGDRVLFGGMSTQMMKDLYDVKSGAPLADYLPTVSLKAKDLAAEMTTVNTDEKGLWGSQLISAEHISNNEVVRGALASRGIFPELLPPAEDIKMVERRLSDSSKTLAEPATKMLASKLSFDKGVDLMIA